MVIANGIVKNKRIITASAHISRGAVLYYCACFKLKKGCILRRISIGVSVSTQVNNFIHINNDRYNIPHFVCCVGGG